jgi:hypothetical protein
MKIPYGVADFYKLRTEDSLYIARSDRIAVIEDLGKSLLFLRPRRFGKSLWLATLASYYDLRLLGEHERLFGDLKIGQAPTPLAHRYFVMRWDFSKIDAEPPAWGVNVGVSARHERIANEIRGYMNASIKLFLDDYREHLPELPELGDDPFHNFEQLLAKIRQTPYRLYLLIDEYDNFANEVLTDDEAVYRELVRTAGPLKYLFKWIKSLMAGSGLDRLFITGVSPLVMSDVTSGMNIVENVYLYPELNSLCGFTDPEVRGLLEDLHAEKAATAPPPWTVLDVREMMRDWYNGYRFAIGTEDTVYNPTLVHYFLKHLQRTGKPPHQMLDSNLAVDEGKLDYLAQVAAGQETAAGEDMVLDLICKEEPLEIRQIWDRFTLQQLLEHSSQDTSFFGSYLFYFGMLTLRKEETPEQTVELVVPNEVMRGLYVDRLRKILMPLGRSRSVADAVLFAFLRSGDPRPLLDFVEATLFPTFSGRDARWANELTVKTLFLTLLWNDRSYIIHSEPEVDHRYADLCLLRRPDARGSSLWDLLFEFKRLSLKKLGMSGKDVKASSRQELMELPKVKVALGEAETQLAAYRAALSRSRGETLKLRSFAVVALGFERLVVLPR